MPKTFSFVFCIAPDSSKHIDKLFEEKINDMLNSAGSTKKEIIALGDINANYLIVNDHKSLKSIFNLYGFKQLIKKATRITKTSATLIDIISSNVPSVIKVCDVIPIAFSDHAMVGCIRKVNHTKFKANTIHCRDFRNLNHDSLINDLNSANWENLYSSSDVNSAWDIFKNVLTTTFNRHAPIVEKRIKGKPAP